MSERTRLGAFVFDPDSGQLTGNGNGAEADVRKLPPQPARLLRLLVARYPDVVSRETIRDAVWGDAPVDFDRSLHFCVRQIRVAFDESATAPTYIETLPRRGYRWLVRPEPVAADPPPDNSLDAVPSIEDDDPSPNEPPPEFAHTLPDHTLPAPTLPAPTRTAVRRQLALVGIVLALILVAIGFAIQPFGAIPAAAEPSYRVAVMPLLPSGESAFAGSHMAEAVLESLSGTPPIEIAVIGPSTTTSYQTQPNPLQHVVAELNVDYVINARFSRKEDRDRVLIEIVQADGAHVWVQSFDESVEPSVIVATLVTALLNLLKR